MEYQWFLNYDSVAEAKQITKGLNALACKRNSYAKECRYSIGAAEIYPNMTENEKTTMAGVYRRKINRRQLTWKTNGLQNWKN